MKVDGDFYTILIKSKIKPNYWEKNYLIIKNRSFTRPHVDPNFISSLEHKDVNQSHNKKFNYYSFFIL